MQILKKNKKSHLKKNMFLDEAVDVQRYDEVKSPQLDKITDKQLGFFWRPEEVDVSKDKKDFNALTPNEQHIFTSNLKRQILLDSVQGRAPNLAFLPIVSLPEVENWIETWSFSETIHSRSYTHIIRNVYPDPSFVFDDLLNQKEIDLIKFERFNLPILLLIDSQSNVKQKFLYSTFFKEFLFNENFVGSLKSKRNPVFESIISFAPLFKAKFFAAAYSNNWLPRPPDK